MCPKPDFDNFMRLLERAIPDRHRDRTEILHLARQLVGDNDCVEAMSDPVVLRAIHLYRKSHPEHDRAEPVTLPALVQFLRSRRGLQQVDALERRLGRIRKILFSLGTIDVLRPVLVNPWEILSLRVLAGIDASREGDLPDTGEEALPGYY